MTNRRWIALTSAVLAIIAAVVVVASSRPHYPAWCQDALNGQVTAAEPVYVQNDITALQTALAQQGQAVSAVGLPTQTNGWMAAIALKAVLHKECGH